MTFGNPVNTGSWQGMGGGPPEQHGAPLAAGLDPVEAYFECITTCTTILREHQ